MLSENYYPYLQTCFPNFAPLLLFLYSVLSYNFPYLTDNMITESVYPINPPNLQGGGEEGVEGPEWYIDL